MKNRTGRQWFLIGGLIIANYAITSVLLPRLPINLFIGTYIIQPVLWGLLAWFSLQGIGDQPTIKVRNKSAFVRLALLIGFIEVLTYTVGGLFFNFGKSPSSFTFTGILANLFYVTALLAGMEFSRAWLVHKLGQRNIFWAIFSVAILYTLLSQPLSKITGFTLGISSIPSNSSTWLPALSESLLATMLALYAGPQASLAYRGILAGFWWFCPIIPGLDWAVKTLIGVIVPVLGVLAVDGLYTAQSSPDQSWRKARKTSLPAGAIVTAVLAVLLIWFATGTLPLKPTVIASGSMEPVFYPGDIVIMAKTPPSQIKPGEIVEYRNPEEKIDIVHRVIQIDNSGGQEYFILKGDNNQSPDATPVWARNIEGKIVFHIPKMGWISLYIKALLKL